MKSISIILCLLLASLAGMAQTQSSNMNTLNLTQEWDKTFSLSEKVNHCKVTFVNRYGIALAADFNAPQLAHFLLSYDKQFNPNNKQ